MTRPKILHEADQPDGERNIMKTRNASSKVIIVSVLAGILIATATLLDRIRVSAFNPQPDPPAFGLISLNPGETLRLNVVFRPAAIGSSDSGRIRHALLGFDLYADGPGSAPSSSEVPTGLCITAHRFADRQSCEVMLAPGEAASFDLAAFTEVVTRVLPSVQDDDRNNRDLIYTVEVRQSGKTLYLMPAVQRSSP